MKKRGIFKCFLFQKPTALRRQIGFNDSVLWRRHLAWVWLLLRGLATIFPVTPFALALNHSTFIVHRPPSRYGVLDLEQWLMNEAIVSAHFLYGTTVSPLAFDPNFLSAKAQTEISNLWTSGLHRSSAALKRPARINPGTCATDWRASPLWRDCVTEIKGKQRQCFRRSPHRLKDNSDDSSAFLINEASLAFPVSSFANIWAQKDSKRSTNELCVGVEMNAQSHQCNNIPLQLKLNLVQKDPLWVFINVWTIFISERIWKIWSFNTIFLLSSPDPLVAY